MTTPLVTDPADWSPPPFYATAARLPIGPSGPGVAAPLTAPAAVVYQGDSRALLGGRYAGAWASGGLSDAPADAIITDPLYDDATHAGARRLGADGPEELINSVQYASRSFTDLHSDLLAWAPHCRTWAILTLPYQHVAMLERDTPPGWRFVRFGVWVKPGAAPQFTGDRPAQGWEAVAILHRTGKGRMTWNGGGLPAVWTVPVERGLHPLQKPLRLVASFVELFTRPGDLVLDPYGGSGTTARAAYSAGRRALTFELDPNHCATIAARLAQAPLPLAFADAPVAAPSLL